MAAAEAWGNVSKEDFDNTSLGDIELSDGAQGVHANTVGAQMDLAVCDGPTCPELDPWSAPSLHRAM
jgi:hypothetical protein